MRDVYTAYLGKRVILSMVGNVIAKGTLEDFSSAVIHLTFGDAHFYVPYDKVVMLTGDL